MIGGQLGDFLGNVYSELRSDVSNAATSAVTNIRTDLSNAVNQLGSGIATNVAGSIAPAGQKPVSIPLSANQLTGVVIGFVVIVGLVLYLAFRRR